MSEKPKGMRPKTELIPLPVKEEDKASMMDEIVNLKIEIESKESELTEMKATHKDDEKVISDVIKEKEEVIEAKFKQVRTGFVDKEVKCLKRKNFDQMPPVMEFLDPKSEEILHTYILDDADFQIQTGEWVVGDPSTVPTD